MIFLLKMLIVNFKKNSFIKHNAVNCAEDYFTLDFMSVPHVTVRIKLKSKKRRIA